MEIKTTDEIIEHYTGHAWDSPLYDKKWVAVDDLKERYIDALKEKSKDKVLQKMFDIFVDLSLDGDKK